jgi:hypothetical protein
MANLIFIVLLSILLSLTSCATIISGTQEDVMFNSEPQGAMLDLNGAALGTTPCTIKLKRNQSHLVYLRKEGYHPYCFQIQKEFNPIFLGNIILGGPVGMLVDVCSGGVYKLSPTSNFHILKNK